MSSEPHAGGVAEAHPFEPFLPPQARLLMLGTFPPAEKRWAMRFYYPNFQNDMWRIVGLCYFGDKHHFVDVEAKRFHQEQLVDFLTHKGIALYDTCTQVIRTRNTASDKDLQVVAQTDLHAMLRALPCCKAIVTAGQLATMLCCQQFGAKEPPVGQSTDVTAEGRPIRIFRMPSSSRAYPMAVERKAEYYQRAFSYIEQHPDGFIDNR